MVKLGRDCIGTVVVLTGVEGGSALVSTYFQNRELQTRTTSSNQRPKPAAIPPIKRRLAMQETQHMIPRALDITPVTKAEMEKAYKIARIKIEAKKIAPKMRISRHISICAKLA